MGVGYTQVSKDVCILGTSLTVQWLRLYTPAAGDMGFIPA